MMRTSPGPFTLWKRPRKNTTPRSYSRRMRTDAASSATASTAAANVKLSSGPGSILGRGRVGQLGARAPHAYGAPTHIDRGDPLKRHEHLARAALRAHVYDDVVERPRLIVDQDVQRPPGAAVLRLGSVTQQLRAATQAPVL